MTRWREAGYRETSTGFVKSKSEENYGNRYNSTDKKGRGWLGNVGTKEAVVTEYSVGEGKTARPLITPNIERGSLKAVVAEAVSGKKTSDGEFARVDKTSSAWAEKRRAMGSSPYKD